MSELTKFHIKAGKERSIERRHPWVFSGAIQKTEGPLTEGNVVEVLNSRGKHLGYGHYQNGSITVRLLTFDGTLPDAAFYNNRIQSAWNLRSSLGLTASSDTTIFRLVHGEGDFLPGLIIDYYNGHCIIQCHSIGMYCDIESIKNALIHVAGNALKSIYQKCTGTLPKEYTGYTGDQYLYGSANTPEIASEHGNRFYVDWIHGQKTGFFIDQRENRLLLGRYSSGKKVLNTFCYSGGFSVYALNNGATLVHSLDSSQKAIDLTNQNIELGRFAPEKHASFVADTMDFIRDLKEDYDIIILDPPAFAKHRGAKHNAVQGYKRLNAHAIRQIKPGGIIFTFSCSQVVEKELFTNTVIAAAIEAKRNVRILEQLHQPADHPINANHPEGEYLKGLVIQVD
ncbi:MAG: class I SAM-dependent rRNA methyltransferase [Bacteroidetes bacterium]|nr:class I SAM-dependent rRNA methyltransferase [Bacteroidota bacterium]